MSEKAAVSLPNPFMPKKVNKRRPPSVKYCAWEVLKDNLGGLSLADLIKEIEGQDLRQFTNENKTPSQIVLAELTKQKDYFLHDKERNLWSIRLEKLSNPEKIRDEDPMLVSAGGSQDKETLVKTEIKTSPIKTTRHGNKGDEKKSWEPKSKGKEGEGEKTGEVIDAKPKASKSSHKRKSTKSSNPRPRKKVKGTALIGVPVKVWWSGENRYFQGKITSYHRKTNTYDVLYKDGDRDDGLEIKKHEIVLKGTEIKYIKIDEHNLDNLGKTGEGKPIAEDINDDDDDKKEEEDMGILEEEKDEDEEEWEKEWEKDEK